LEAIHRTSWGSAGTSPDGSSIEGTLEFLSRIFQASCSEAGFRLDGSLQSIEELDRVAASVAPSLSKSCATRRRMTQEEVEDFVAGAGAYFGKIVLDHLGGTLIRDEEGQLCIVGLADLVVRPFDVAAHLAAEPEGESPFAALVAGIRDRLTVPVIQH
jgi:hypothetical protein